LNVDMTPLSSISTSGPDMSVAMSVELGTSTAVDFDDRSREIQDTAAAMLELGDPTAGAPRSFRNPSISSHVPNVMFGNGQYPCSRTSVQVLTD